MFIVELSRVMSNRVDSVKSVTRSKKAPNLEQNRVQSRGNEKAAEILKKKKGE